MSLIASFFGYKTVPDFERELDNASKNGSCEFEQTNGDVCHRRYTFRNREAISSVEKTIEKLWLPFFGVISFPFFGSWTSERFMWEKMWHLSPRQPHSLVVKISSSSDQPTLLAIQYIDKNGYREDGADALV